ncbi:hypothetical protein HAX54_048707 [Datura stramonium]|uniref:Uncharacterized protein n=1 Tax=Datura stramonium TaxID=4076 RepID=A0ABS8SUX4_DATST|nr:hypothetical protein [Datura stramonium]
MDGRILIYWESSSWQWDLMLQRVQRLQLYSSPSSKPSVFPEEKNEFSNHGTPESHEEAEPSNQMLGGRVSRKEELSPPQNGFLHVEGSRKSRTECLREESAGTPTSHGSCQGSPCAGNEFSPQNELVNSPAQHAQEPFGGMLIEDAGSSHDLRNLCSPGDTLVDDRVPNTI